MKKIILLVRHAKSGWNDASLSDLERKLTDRGKSDAKMMAKRLQKRSIEIDAFVSSPAKRASKTAKIFMKQYDKNKKNLQLIPTSTPNSMLQWNLRYLLQSHRRLTGSFTP